MEELSDLDLSSMLSMMLFQLPWTKILVAGVTFVVTSEIASHRLKRFFQKRKKPKKPAKTFQMPGWAVSKMRSGELVPPTIVEEEQLVATSVRKPPDLWNTSVIFPDKYYRKHYGSALKQLISYFDQAKLNIFVCNTLITNRELTTVLQRKHMDGLVILVITDYNYWMGHYNTGAEYLKKQGIEVRIRNNGYLMHNKYAIIDEEAVITGSLNWTKQGVERNNENVLVTTDPKVVPKYLKDFYKQWNVSKPAELPPVPFQRKTFRFNSQSRLN